MHFRKFGPINHILIEWLYTNTVQHKIFFYLMYYTVQLCVMSITGRTSQFLGYLPAHCQTFNSLVNTAEDGLLSSVIRNSYHALRPLFPPVKISPTIAN